MAEFWINTYHIDGFRIDEFKGINNWDFIREFRNCAWQNHQKAFPGRPFIVIAEDSGRHPEITQHLDGEDPTVDAIWDFDFRDELRRLVDMSIKTENGHTPSERVQSLVIGDRLWNDWQKNWREGQLLKDGRGIVGFTDLTQRIVYNTSHDVEGQLEQRLVPYFNTSPDFASYAYDLAFAAFALTLTAVGIPMFLVTLSML